MNSKVGTKGGMDLRLAEGSAERPGREWMPARKQIAHVGKNRSGKSPRYRTLEENDEEKGYLGSGVKKIWEQTATATEMPMSRKNCE